VAHKLTKKKPEVGEELPEHVKRKLKALKDVAGLLSDLSAKEWEAFLEAVRRRPLFGNRPSK